MLSAFFDLPPFGIDRIIIFHDQLGDRYQLVSLLFECGGQLVESFCRMFAAVVAEDDRSISQIFVV